MVECIIIIVRPLGHFWGTVRLPVVCVNVAIRMVIRRKLVLGSPLRYLSAQSIILEKKHKLREICARA